MHFEASMESLSRAFDAERKTWSSKLEAAATGRTRAQQELERIAVEKERLLRQVKRMKASILLSASSGSEFKWENGFTNDAEAQAREDFTSQDFDIRAEQRRDVFQGRTGQRVGKVKYREWFDEGDSISLDKENLNN